MGRFRRRDVPCSGSRGGPEAGYRQRFFSTRQKLGLCQDAAVVLPDLQELSSPDHVREGLHLLVQQKGRK